MEMFLDAGDLDFEDQDDEQYISDFNNAEIDGLG